MSTALPIRIHPTHIRTISEADTTTPFFFKPEASSTQRQAKKQSNLALLGRFPLVSRSIHESLFLPKTTAKRFVAIRSLSMPDLHSSTSTKAFCLT